MHPLGVHPLWSSTRRLRVYSPFPTPLAAILRSKVEDSPRPLGCASWSGAREQAVRSARRDRRGDSHGAPSEGFHPKGSSQWRWRYGWRVFLHFAEKNPSVGFADGRVVNGNEAADPVGKAAPRLRQGQAWRGWHDCWIRSGPNPSRLDSFPASRCMRREMARLDPLRKAATAPPDVGGDSQGAAGSGGPGANARRAGWT